MKLETIIVGYDGSPDGDEALDTAIQLAGKDAAVHVVTAYHSPSDRQVAELTVTLPEEYVASFDPIAMPRRHLRTAEQKLDHAEVEHKGHLIEGDPAGAILDVAESADADLIVVGSRGVGRVGRFLRGSVSSRVANHAQTNLLIVHGQEPGSA